MAISSESKAKLAGMQSSEWNKFIKSFVEQNKQFQLDKAALTQAKDDEYKLTTGLATLAYIFTASFLENDEDLTDFQKMAYATGASTAIGAVTSAGDTRPEDAFATLEEAGYDVYNPMFNTTRAWEMEQGIQTEKDLEISAYDTYASNKWVGLGLEIGKKAGSYALSPDTEIFPWEG